MSLQLQTKTVVYLSSYTIMFQQMILVKIRILQIKPSDQHNIYDFDFFPVYMIKFSDGWSVATPSLLNLSVACSFYD